MQLYLFILPKNFENFYHFLHPNYAFQLILFSNLKIEIKVSLVKL